MQKEKKLYQKTWFVVLMLVLVFPVGIYLMWKHADWKNAAKVVVTILVGVLIVLAAILFIYSADTTQFHKNTNAETTQDTDSDKAPAPHENVQKLSKDYSAEDKECQRIAYSYIDLGSFSKQGLIEQLSSDSGDGFPREIAEKVVNDIEKGGDVDWTEEAIESAWVYYDSGCDSKAKLIDMLCSEDKYTKSEAEKAADEVFKR